MLIAITGLALAVFGQSAGQVFTAQGDRLVEAQRLDACILKLDDDPEGAYDDGLKWINEGGRPYARQCTALALVELGQPAEGAARLEDLANAENGGSISQRIIYLTQSGNAWLLAGAPEAALVTLNNAIKLSPTNPLLKADRAAAYMALGQWTEAARDLNIAKRARPNDTSILQLRAETRLNLDNLDGAKADVDAAMAIDHTDIKTLLLRGRVIEAMRVDALSDDTPIVTLEAN